LIIIPIKLYLALLVLIVSFRVQPPVLFVLLSPIVTLGAAPVFIIQTALKPLVCGLATIGAGASAFSLGLCWEAQGE
jgi:hypothetical protein